jgi:peptidoglycan hydrolase-like protein with peptidoglycan-binding domain
LDTADLAQTAQNYFIAPGYEPGNPQGVVDTVTTVAIPSSRRRKGLEVTGRLTPNLVGIPAAEVDSPERRGH